MIVILRPGAQKARVEALMGQIKQQGVDIHYSQGATETILGLVGDTTHVDEDWLRASDIVEDVRRVSEPYKLANRRFHPKDTHVNVCGRAVPFRGWKTKDSSCCWRPRRRPACRLSPKL